MSKYNKDMTIAEAMSMHTRAREVFAGYHLGGCSHCGIADFETIEQVCSGYGVPIDAILEALEGLPEEKTEDGEPEIKSN